MIPAARLVAPDGQVQEVEVLEPPPGTPRVVVVDWTGPWAEAVDAEKVVLRCPACGGATVAEPYELTARLGERRSPRPAELTLRGRTLACPACHTVFVPVARMRALFAAAGSAP